MRKPTFVRIGRGDLACGYSTEKLYRLEERRTNAISLAAVELGRVLVKAEILRPTNPEAALKFMDAHPQFYWDEVVPEALANVLDSFDPKIGEVVTEAFLEHRGYKVTLERICCRCGQIIRGEKFLRNGPTAFLHPESECPPKRFGVVTMQFCEHNFDLEYDCDQCKAKREGKPEPMKLKLKKAKP